MTTRVISNRVDNYTLFFDGCSKSNPGPAGIGAVLYKNGQEIRTTSNFIGLQTNDVAEYMAFIKGLDIATKLKIKTLHVKGDSLLVINQMKGDWAVKHDNMIPLYEEAKHLVKAFESITYEHVKRNENSRADKLANESIVKSWGSRLEDFQEDFQVDL